MKRFSKFIQEAKLSQSQRDRLDDLILNVHMTTHPEYDGDEGPTKYLNMIRKEFGDKVAKQVNDGIEKVHWGRDNSSGGNDKLAWRKGGARITKSGKMNAQDVKALKNRIKQDKAWGGITKAVKLPEEVELDEASKPNQYIEVINKFTGAKSHHEVHPSKAFAALNHHNRLWNTKSARIVSGKEAEEIRASKMKKEEVEQIDEISQEKLRDYHAAAGADRQKAKGEVEKIFKDKKPTPEKVQKTADAYKRFIKRGKGMTAAANKMSEEVELDELNKSTLASYVKKASADQYFRGKNVQYHDTKAQKADGPFAKETKRKHYAKASNAERIAANRDTGIGRAVDRLTRESLELDEVSTEKLRDYASAALQDKNKTKADKRWKYAGKAMQTVADREVKAAHDRKYNKMEEVELDEVSTKVMIPKSRYLTILKAHGPKKLARTPKGEMQYRGAEHFAHNKDTDTHITQTYSHPDHNLATIERHKHHPTGETRYYMYRKTQKEEVELDEVSDKKLDAYRQKAFADQPSGDDGSDKYRKRKFGRDLAFAKQTGRAKVLATKEEVEQIDEISQKTLRSYMDKAGTQRLSKSKEAASHFRQAGMTGSASDTEKGMAAAKVANKRAKGYETAFSKNLSKVMKKEEVELDELNKSTLASYVKKAKGELVKNRQGYSDALTKKGYSWDDRKYFSRKSDNKAKGIDRAVDRLAKEEVEINEASDLRITKVYNKFPKKATYAVHSPDRKYYKEFDTEAEAKKHLETKK